MGWEKKQEKVAQRVEVVLLPGCSCRLGCPLCKQRQGSQNRKNLLV